MSLGIAKTVAHQIELIGYVVNNVILLHGISKKNYKLKLKLAIWGWMFDVRRLFSWNNCCMYVASAYTNLCPFHFPPIQAHLFRHYHSVHPLILLFFTSISKLTFPQILPTIKPPHPADCFHRFSTAQWFVLYLYVNDWFDYYYYYYYYYQCTDLSDTIVYKTLQGHCTVNYKTTRNADKQSLD